MGIQFCEFVCWNFQFVILRALLILRLGGHFHFASLMAFLILCVSYKFHFVSLIGN